MEAPLFKINQDFSITNHFTLPKGEQFTLFTSSGNFEALVTSLLGEHQTENAALAVMAALYLNDHGLYQLREQNIRTGLTNAYWPGRFEIISEQPLVILDGAHNDEGITALVHELNQRYQDKKINIVFSALLDKSLEKMIAKIDEIADRITFVSFDYPRAASANVLYEISHSRHKSASENWQAVIEEEIRSLKVDNVFVITGSLYFISEVKPFLLRHFV